MKRHHDLVVIGSGSGNMMIDARFDDLDVAIVESGRWGGTCLNVGCIPTKMFVYAADIAEAARDSSRLGVDVTGVSTRWPDVRDRVFGRIDARGQNAYARRSSQTPNLTVYDGEARFIGERELAVVTNNGETVRLSADDIVVSAGARPTVPDVVLNSGVPFDTSDTVMRIDDVPERMIVLGSGYIAAELSHVFSAMGSNILLVARGSRLLSSQDDTISEQFTELAAKRWNLLLDKRLVDVHHSDERVTLVFDDGSTVEGDRLLVAVGRTPNSDRLNLQAAGIELDPFGRVVTDSFMRTTASHVWSLGDITSAYQLKHVANWEARTVAHNLLNPDDLRPVQYEAVPAAVFTEPQIASVGLTEQAARATHTDIAVHVRRYDEVAYGWAMEDTTGFCKVIADRSTGMLVGAHVLGPQAALLVQQLTQAMTFKVPVRDLIAKQLWIHPALAEVVENALIGLDLSTSH